MLKQEKSVCLHVWVRYFEIYYMYMQIWVNILKKNIVHDKIYSIHPIKNVILTSREVKPSQLWLNIYKTINIYGVELV